MSAYLVSTDTIDHLLGIMRDHDQLWLDRSKAYPDVEDLIREGTLTHRPDTLRASDVETIGQILYHQNIRSVQARYPSDTWDTMPGPMNAPRVYTFRHERRPDPVSVLKSLACLEYQSCETDDWTQTAAHELCQRLRHLAINYLQGYADAPWGWTREDAEVTR